jgi:hypothetical protein
LLQVLRDLGIAEHTCGMRNTLLLLMRINTATNASTIVAIGTIMAITES